MGAIFRLIGYADASIIAMSNNIDIAHYYAIYYGHMFYRAALQHAKMSHVRCHVPSRLISLLIDSAISVET